MNAKLNLKAGLLLFIILLPSIIRAQTECKILKKMNEYHHFYDDKPQSNSLRYPIESKKDEVSDPDFLDDTDLWILCEQRKENGYYPIVMSLSFTDFNIAFDSNEWYEGQDASIDLSDILPKELKEIISEITDWIPEAKWQFGPAIALASDLDCENKKIDAAYRIELTVPPKTLKGTHELTIQYDDQTDRLSYQVGEPTIDTELSIGFKKISKEYNIPSPIPDYNFELKLDFNLTGSLAGKLNVPFSGNQMNEIIPDSRVLSVRVDATIIGELALEDLNGNKVQSVGVNGEFFLLSEVAYSNYDFQSDEELKSPFYYSGVQNIYTDLNKNSRFYYIASKLDLRLEMPLDIEIQLPQICFEYTAKEGQGKVYSNFSCVSKSNINILNPIESSKANVGPKDNANKFMTEVQILGPMLHGLSIEDFEVQIGQKNAKVLSVIELSDSYKLQVMPPTQEENGIYNFVVSVPSHNLFDMEIEAIRYSELLNVDFVLVIDRSGSMSGSKIQAAKSAAAQFVDYMFDRIVQGDMVGVVSFHSDARVDFPLTAIDYSAKEQAISAINSIYSGGGTSIGDGLWAAQRQLDTYGKPDHEWAIILLSDGMETSSRYVSEVLPLIPGKTDIYTIAFGSDADEPMMQDIANETGGQYYFPERYGSIHTAINNIYQSIRVAILGEEIIATKSGRINSGETTQENVQIDPTVSQSTFGVSWVGSDIDLTLVDPAGKIIDSVYAESSLDISFVSGSVYEFYTIVSPVPGEWTLNVLGVDIPRNGEDYMIRVTGQTDLTLDAYFDKKQYEVGQPVTVLVSLSDASGPITGTTVEVIVQAPSQDMSLWKKVNGDLVPTLPLRKSISALKSLHKSSNSGLFILYDDGAHGDGLANDGVYGNLYTETHNSGSYIFNIEVSGKTSSGDSFTRFTQRSLFIEPATHSGSISGTIYHPESETATIYVQAWQNDPAVYGNPDYITSIATNGQYILNHLQDGVYYIAAYWDRNNNGGQDANEPFGIFGAPDPVLIVNGNAASAVDISLDLPTLFAYPNPCYPNKGQNQVKITNLPSHTSKVRLYTISGHLVRQIDKVTQVRRGATVIWDLKNDAGEEVARGVYIYIVSEPDSKTRKTGKIVIIK